MLSNCAALILVQNDEYFLSYTLGSTIGLFEKYIVYDVGSSDSTKNILNAFVDQMKDSADFVVRFLPDCPPKVQGVFRNSMIAEAGTDFYYLLDGDEVYPPASLQAIRENYDEFTSSGRLYGVVWRTEVARNLKGKFSEIRTHHRLYHRTATWGGSHPGEYPIIKQEPNTEFMFSKLSNIYHFHNTDRSSMDHLSHKRADRKNKKTYSPGVIEEFNLLEEVPILRKPIMNFPVNPYLQELQAEYANANG